PAPTNLTTTPTNPTTLMLAPEWSILSRLSPTNRPSVNDHPDQERGTCTVLEPSRHNGERVPRRCNSRVLEMVDNLGIGTKVMLLCSGIGRSITADPVTPAADADER